MNTKDIVIGLLVVAALVAGVVLPRPLPPSTQVVKEVTKQLGAFAGPEIISDYLSFNGIKHLYGTGGGGKIAMVAATTTPCIFNIKATSTLIAATADFDISSSTQPTIATFAKNPKTTDSFATTTVLAELAIAAGAKAQMFVMSTSTVNLAGTPAAVGSGTNAAFNFVPGDKLILGFAGGQHPTAGQPAGACQGEFLSL